MILAPKVSYLLAQYHLFSFEFRISNPCFPSYIFGALIGGLKPWHFLALRSQDCQSPKLLPTSARFCP
jgi:hypothetical protein